MIVLDVIVLLGWIFLTVCYFLRPKQAEVPNWLIGLFTFNLVILNLEFVIDHFIK